MDIEGTFKSGQVWELGKKREMDIEGKVQIRAGVGKQQE